LLQSTSYVYNDLIAIGFSIFEESSLVPLETLWTCRKSQLFKWSIFPASVGGQNISNRQLLRTLDQPSKDTLICELWLKRLILQDMMEQAGTVLNSVDQMCNLRQKGEDGPKEGHDLDQLDKHGVIIILQITAEVMVYLQICDEMNKEEGTDNEELMPICVVQEQARYFLSISFDFLQLVVERIDFVKTSRDLLWLLSDPFVEHAIAKSTVEQLCTDFARISSHLDQAFLSCKVVDFVSLFSTCSKTKVDELITANWNQFLLSKCESEEDKLGRLPHSFAKLVNQYSKNASVVSSTNSNKKANIFNLFEMTLSLTPENYNDTVIRHHLLAHWSNKISNGSDFCEEYHALTDCLHMLVNKLASDVLTDSSMQQIDDTRGREPINIPIQSLHFRTIPMVYKLTLNMAITSFAFNIHESRKSDVSPQVIEESMSSDTIERSKKQLHIPEELVKIFDSMIKLYASNFKLFPGRTLGITTRASSLLIKSCEIQIENSLKWKTKLQSTPRKKNTHSRF
jgi:hypothetical protein